MLEYDVFWAGYFTEKEIIKKSLGEKGLRVKIINYLI